MSRVDAMHKYAQHEMAKAFADSPLLLGCLRLNDVITNEGTKKNDGISRTLGITAIFNASRTYF